MSDTTSRKKAGRNTSVHGLIGHPLRNLNQPVACFKDGIRADLLVGTVEWEFAQDCLEAHDVATGQLMVAQLYPQAGQKCSRTLPASSPTTEVIFSMFAPTDLAHPVWSVSAGPTTPLAVSAGHILVNGPSGLHVLSAESGGITVRVSGEFPAQPEHEYIHGHPVGGLVQQTVLESKTRVLDLNVP